MTMFFPVTVKQVQVINCFRCLSDKSRTGLQHLFKDIAFSKKNPNVKFTAYHIFLWVLVAGHPLQQFDVSLLSETGICIWHRPCVYV